MTNNKRIGVALSGGGYRAAGFHLGTLKKLAELEVLDKLDVLSTISGGSIVGAAYCLHTGDWESFESRMITLLSTKSVIKYVLTSIRFWVALLPLFFSIVTALWLPFTELACLSIIPSLLIILCIIKWQFKILPLSKIIERAYDKFFFDGATLSDLCEHTEIAIGSTNLQTTRHFTFSKRKMGDSFYAYQSNPVFFKNERFPVARAVMASTCVPFAFSPVIIAPEFYVNPEQAKTIEPVLVDGGVYDNQGVHKLTQPGSSYSCDIVVVSDAGNKLPFAQSYNNMFTLLLRTSETFMARIKNFQMVQNIYQRYHGREVAYLSLGWDIEKCVTGFYDNLVSKNISQELVTAHGLTDEWVNSPRKFRNEIIDHISRQIDFDNISANALMESELNAVRKIATGLNCIKVQLIKDMIKHSSILTEVQIKLYCPSLFTK